MTCTENALREFGRNIQQLIEKQNLSREACYSMFREILENSQPDLHQGAFLAALAAKGATCEEIAGAWQAIVEFDTCKIDIEGAEPLVENSGTGMDALKTFNVSTAAAVTAAAGGVRMARHGSRALTSACGTVDVLEALGIDVECPVSRVGRSIALSGIGLFNGMSAQVHPNALFRILSQIRFGSTLNIAASLASPCRPTHALRGVYAVPVMDRVTEVMQAIGYRRGMVVHGFDADGGKGMDEISTLGETAVQEFFPDGTRNTYRLAPEELGLRQSRLAEVAALGDVQAEAVRCLKVIGGIDHRACIDLVCANAGAVLYVAGKAEDLPTGVSLARGLVFGGQALAKLCHWVSVQCDDQQEGLQRFIRIAARAGLDREVAACLG